MKKDSAPKTKFLGCQLVAQMPDGAELWHQPDGTYARYTEDTDALASLSLDESVELLREILAGDDCTWNGEAIDKFFDHVVAGLKGGAK